jgi:hypothetical protein
VRGDHGVQVNQGVDLVLVGSLEGEAVLIQLGSTGSQVIHQKRAQ